MKLSPEDKWNTCGINHKERQDEFIQNEEYWDTIRETKITEDYKQSLRDEQMIRQRNVYSTSTKKQECIGHSI